VGRSDGDEVSDELGALLTVGPSVGAEEGKKLPLGAALGIELG